MTMYRELIRGIGHKLDEIEEDKTRIIKARDELKKYHDWVKQGEQRIGIAETQLIKSLEELAMLQIRLKAEV